MAVSKNQEIENLLVSIHSAYTELRGRGLRVSAQMIKDFVQGRVFSEQSLLSVLEDFVGEQKERVGIDLSPQSFRSYLKALSDLEALSKSVMALMI